MPSVGQITATVLLVYLVNLSSTLQPSFIQFNSSLAFYEDDSRILMQTKNISMNYTMCLEYHLQIRGPGIRFQSYSCRTTGNDECIVQSFNGDDLIMHKENCYSLRAWTLNNYSYTFFFEYDVKSDRYIPNPHAPKQNENEETVTAILKLNNVKLCSDVCQKTNSTDSENASANSTTQVESDNTIDITTTDDNISSTVGSSTLTAVNTTEEFR